jgi:hypothetical protein
MERDYAAQFRSLQKEVYATSKDEFCRQVLEKLEAEELPVAEVYPDCAPAGASAPQVGGQAAAAAAPAAPLSEDYVRGYETAYDMTYTLYYAQGNTLGKQRALGVLYEAPQVLRRMQDIAAAAVQVGGALQALLAGRRSPRNNKTLTWARGLLDKIKERTKTAAASGR